LKLENGVIPVLPCYQQQTCQWLPVKREFQCLNENSTPIRSGRKKNLCLSLKDNVAVKVLPVEMSESAILTVLNRLTTMVFWQ
jgi:hypothetical protein